MDYLTFALAFLFLFVIIGLIFSWVWLMAERGRNRRITAAMYRLGDFYRDGTKRMEALRAKWNEDDAS